MDNCIFCKIIKGEIPSYTIYEDEIVKVFLDVNPKSNGHTLIIPKKHFKDLDDIDELTLNHILKIAKKIKELIDIRLNPTGLTLIQNNGSVEEVKHFHLHLIPVYSSNTLLDLDEVYNKLK